jgi:TPP-dependent pyruvate/acetoin dehydrogenase alpha subunit
MATRSKKSPKLEPTAAEPGVDSSTKWQPPSAEVLNALNVTDTSEDAAANLKDRDPDFIKKLYEGMVKARAFEDRMSSMYRSGDLLGSYYSGNYHEAISVGMIGAMTDDDYLCPLHRDVGAHLWRGMPPEQIMASFMGKEISPTGGRDGTLHFGRLDLNTYNPPSHIPANFPVATGMAFASQYRGENRVTAAVCGDGSTSRADFHESVNIASVLKLPVIFMIQNNQWAYSTPLNLQSQSANFAMKAVAYGMPGIKCDGTDVVAVYDAMREAVERARAGGGPTIIEAVTMRMHGHAEHDSADYVPSEMLEEWAKKDPVDLIEKRLIEAGIISVEDAQATRDEAHKWAIASRAIAIKAKMPDPANIEDGVFAD